GFHRIAGSVHLRAALFAHAISFTETNGPSLRRRPFAFSRQHSIISPQPKQLANSKRKLAANQRETRELYFCFDSCLFANFAASRLDPRSLAESAVMFFWLTADG
ncbi:MAG TPA: hypothetical protein VGJ51_07375, partial [Candidatus Angelobacter sp.]